MVHRLALQGIWVDLLFAQQLFPIHRECMWHTLFLCSIASPPACIVVGGQLVLPAVVGITATSHCVAITATTAVALVLFRGCGALSQHSSSHCHSIVVKYEANVRTIQQQYKAALVTKHCFTSFLLRHFCSGHFCGFRKRGVRGINIVA